MNLRDSQVKVLLDLVNTEIDKRTESEYNIPTLIDLKEQLILHGVVKSLPIKKGAMCYSEWKKFNKITESGTGGYKWDGSNYTAYSIEMMYKNYTM